MIYYLSPTAPRYMPKKRKGVSLHETTVDSNFSTVGWAFPHIIPRCKRVLASYNFVSILGLARASMFLSKQGFLIIPVGSYTECLPAEYVRKVPKGSYQIPNA